MLFKVAKMNFDIVRQFPDVTTPILVVVSKSAAPDEKSTDLQVVGLPVKEKFEEFAVETGRQIHLEVEPGSFLVANACALLSSADVVSTGEGGYTIKLNRYDRATAPPSMGLSTRLVCCSLPTGLS